MFSSFFRPKSKIVDEQTKYHHNTILFVLPLVFYSVLIWPSANRSAFAANAPVEMTRNPVWFSRDSHTASSLAWGDFDGDGDLDLATGNGMWQPDVGQSALRSRVYLNENNNLQATAYWTSPFDEVTVSIAWGDFDSDGDLDLATGNYGTTTKIYRNNAGVIDSNNPWQSIEVSRTTSIAWGDIDSDGNLDR